MSSIKKVISKVNPGRHSGTSSHASNHSTTYRVPTAVSDSASDGRPVQVHNPSTDVSSEASKRTLAPSFTEQKLERKAEREQREQVETEAKARRAREAHEKASKSYSTGLSEVEPYRTEGDIQDHLRHNYGDLPVNRSQSHQSSSRYSPDINSGKRSYRAMVTVLNPMTSIGSTNPGTRVTVRARVHHSRPLGICWRCCLYNH